MPITRRSAALAGALLIPALVLTSCASADDSSSGEATGADSSLPEDLVAAAVAQAETIAGDQELAGSLSMIGLSSSSEVPAWQAVLAPFTQATGVEVDYTGSQDLPAIVQAGLDAGDPPDIVNTNGSALMRGYAEDGLVLSLGDVVDAETVAQFNPDLLESVTVDGEIHGVWNAIDVLGLWYSTAEYDGPTEGTWSDLLAWAQNAEPDDAAFCMGLESGPGTGWPAQVFLESVFIKLHGAEKFAEWARGDLPWTSPEVREAFEQLGAVTATDSTVEGGATGALNRPFGEYVAGMFSEPQRCQLALLGGYVVNLAKSGAPDIESPADLDFFPVPAEDPTAAADQNVVGAIAFGFEQNDSPELRAALAYLASPEAQALIAASGIWQAANTAVAPEAYPTDTGRALASRVTEAESVVAGPSSTQPLQVNVAWLAAIVGYLQDPASLDAQLASVDAAVAG